MDNAGGRPALAVDIPVGDGPITEKDDQHANTTIDTENNEDLPQSDNSFDKEDSDIQIIEVESPVHEVIIVDSPEAELPTSAATNTSVSSEPSESNPTENESKDNEEKGSVTFTTIMENSVPLRLIASEIPSDIAPVDHVNTPTCSKAAASEISQETVIACESIVSNAPTAQPVVGESLGDSFREGPDTEGPASNPDSAGTNQSIQKSAPVNGDSHLSQAAIKLLQKLEFKNPGRKQIEYGLFNPEESEREKKKLRRFQMAKPRGSVCYKEDGTLLDGRDICDCLAETCPGCFYPCPQCTSQKCGPTCRINRKWVYDYIEDEGRTYRVEFPEQMNV